MRHPNDLKFIRVEIYVTPQMIYSEKWCCCSGMRVFKTMHLHNCIFILPILMCDFCLMTLLWFETTTWNSNHKWNHMSSYFLLHSKKRKDTFERLEKLTPVFSLFSWNYLYYSIWKESYGYSLFPSASVYMFVTQKRAIVRVNEKDC